MKILMLNLPFSGHTNPTLSLAKALVDRGHAVTYVNAEEMRGKITATGAAFVPYQNYPAEPTEKQKKTQCFRALFETAMSLKDDFDLLIYEMFFYPGIDIARKRKIPCIRQFSQPAWNENTWKDASPVFKFSAKLIDVQVFPRKTAKKLGTAYSCLKRGVIESKPDLNIVYLPAAFQAHRNEFGEDYLFRVPDLIGQDAGKIIPYDSMKGPIVYISLGSIMSDKGFCKTCIRAFGSTEFSVILNTGKVSVASLGKIPENIYAYSFVPQIEVLKHADVFLTHCGMNSINEAMSLGVPMVAMPYINDQLTNAKQITSCGLGLQIRSFPYSDKQMLDAVRTVYKDQRYKENAAGMMEKIKSQITMDEIIQKIEQLK